MTGIAKWLVSGLGSSALLAGMFVGPALASSAFTPAATKTCSGTSAAPGVLAGSYPGNVIVKGVCAVNAGPAVITGNLTIDPGGAVLAIYALNDKTHTGFSSLTVKKNVTVEKGATLELGCEPNFADCADNKVKTPTLESRGIIDGSLIATAALGVLVHNSSIGGSVTQQGGGGGLSCTHQGIFKGSVYSDYEDNVIGGSVSVTGLTSCWLGMLRNEINGNLTFSTNKMADHDANEVLHNYVSKSLTCKGNSPAVKYGDSHSTPNAVNGTAVGQCGFTALAPNPAPNGPLEPISVPATS